MNIESMLVFDEELAGVGPYYTSQELNERLGRYDQLSFQAVVDKVSVGGGTLSVRLQHSANDRHFVNKNGGPELTTAPLSAGATNIAGGGDSSSAPTLGYVRLAISLSSSISAHVKVYATMRDQSGAMPGAAPSGATPRPKLLIG